MLLFGVCFVLYFIKLSAGKGFYLHMARAFCQGSYVTQQGGGMWPRGKMDNF